MSLDTALARVELAYLSDVVRDNMAVVKDLDHVSTLQEDGAGGGFQKSLRIKAMIDELEHQAQKQPSWRVLAALVRSEYRLWRLNEPTALRQNPFLSHWVEAIQRLDAVTRSHEEPATTDDLSARDIAATRLEMIKRLFLSQVLFVASATPQQLYDVRYPGTPFDLEPYIRILEEEGIYEPSAVQSTPAPSVPGVTHDSTHVTDRVEWKDSIMSTMTSDPSHVFAELTHLPIAIPALEFLTNLVTTFTLEKHNIDPKEVVLCFVQHALRLVEHMGQSATINHQPPVQTDIGIVVDDEHGREAQSRALRLLILFLKNLDRKGMIVVDLDKKYTLYYDLEGMYRSYMWMREVREFKTLIEQGDSTDEG
ncbi:hypothetical protein SVAN01_06862 [Stagonosporopsis vannaccii]|nr:hypothetical protein SVAN01_06862 [Stagonosporopsis vannaccii]